MKRCVSRSQKRVFEEVVQGSRDTISRLCVPGPVQRGKIWQREMFRLAWMCCEYWNGRG